MRLSLGKLLPHLCAGGCWIASIVSCRPPAATTSSTINAMNSSSTLNNCENARQTISSLDLRAWQGLPAGCDWQAWTGPLPSDWREVYARPLGSSARPAHQLDVAVPGYQHPHLYFVAGGAVLFEALVGPRLEAFRELVKENLEVYTHVARNRKPTSPLDDLLAKPSFIQYIVAR